MSSMRKRRRKAARHPWRPESAPGWVIYDTRTPFAHIVGMGEPVEDPIIRAYHDALRAGVGWVLWTVPAPN